jgi:hypothetical protein
MIFNILDIDILINLDSQPEIQAVILWLISKKLHRVSVILNDYKNGVDTTMIRNDSPILIGWTKDIKKRK